MRLILKCLARLSARAHLNSSESSLSLYRASRGTLSSCAFLFSVSFSRFGLLPAGSFRTPSRASLYRITKLFASVKHFFWKFYCLFFAFSFPFITNSFFPFERALPARGSSFRRRDSPGPRFSFSCRPLFTEAASAPGPPRPPGTRQSPPSAVPFPARPGLRPRPGAPPGGRASAFSPGAE